MERALRQITKYCEGISSSNALSASEKTFDACIRNFQILGDAAAKVPAPVRRTLPDFPWRQMKAMRKLLVHEYFGVSPSILWSTIKNDLPTLLGQLELANLGFDRPSHPWRICPAGEIYVRGSEVDAHLREGVTVRQHSRREHCRELSSSTLDVLSVQEVLEIGELHFGSLSEPKLANVPSFGPKGAEFNDLIRGWVRYWNDQLTPHPALDANRVKILIATESSFDPRAGKGRRGAARGLMQLLPLTFKALRGYRGELKSHLFEFTDEDAWDPAMNIALGVRWLHQKRVTASRRLGRAATWDEAVEDYKDYLRRRPKGSDRPHPKMSRYFELLKGSRK